MTIYMLAKRDNNAKRNFLLVNMFQAKHIPVSPSLALSLFGKLGELIKKSCTEKKILVLGFAETATAIAAEVAKVLNAAYIHTTRETLLLEESKKLLEFKEEHSHAVEHALYCDSPGIFRDLERIIFVDDEMSTGKTVINFIHALKEKELLPTGVKISTAVIISGLSQKYKNNLQENNVDLHSLYSIDNSKFEEEVSKMGEFSEDVEFCYSAPEYKLQIIEAHLSTNPRYGVNIQNYTENCSALSKQILSKVDDLEGKRILVLGTEEFMYPAIHLGAMLENINKKCSVFTHSTTRSPIFPCRRDDYPIKSRFKLSSLYSPERRTYLYNLQKYDKVIVVTDAPGDAGQLCAALSAAGNDDITLVKCKAHF